METTVLVVLIAAIMLAGIYRVVMKRKRLKTFGDYPPTLLRFFPKKEYAEQFLAGSVRFGLLDYYATIEEKARKDGGEGKGQFAAPAKSVTTVHINGDGEIVGATEAPGDMNYQVHFGNPTYIVCCTDPEGVDIDALKKKFGPYVVRINNPLRLGQELTDKFAGLENTHPLAGSVVECARVSYDKGERRDAEPTQDQLLKAAYSQKPDSYSEENEVRLVVFRRHLVNRDKAEATTTVEVGPLDYAELLD